MDDADAAGCRDRLLTWFAASARSLPWRTRPRDPYRVVVSELMLQQTQVDRVVPYFERFVDRFPGWQALAAACEDEVVAAWSGLGYYRRARHLHRLAGEVVARGGLPSAPADLERLPGIGPYTAAAVASQAFGVAVPVLDGNVRRVAARVLAFSGDPRSADGERRMRAWVGALLPDDRPGDLNEALMELGATVCAPSAPSCAICPLLGACAAAARGDPTAYPRPRSRRPTEEVAWTAVCCVDPEGRWLLRRVLDGPVLRGLWLPPLVDGDLSDDLQRAVQAAGLRAAPARVRSAGAVRHGITHRRITVHVVALEVAEGEEGEGWSWVDPCGTGVPTSSLLAKLVAAVEMTE